MDTAQRRQSALQMMLPWRDCNYPNNGDSTEQTRAAGVFLYSLGVNDTIVAVLRGLQQARVYIGLRIGI
jgi:hypothetical protein